MILKRLSLERVMFNEKNFGTLKKMLKKHCATPYPICKYRKKNLVKDLMTALILCHNVTPVFDDDGNRSFQASSPDEIALVEFAESVGMKLITRTNEEIKIQTAANIEEEYKILYEFPFSSERKRMGIVL
jgi:phospholipid-translocating ATPase